MRIRKGAAVGPFPLWLFTNTKSFVPIVQFFYSLNKLLLPVSKTLQIQVPLEGLLLLYLDSLHLTNDT